MWVWVGVACSSLLGRMPVWRVYVRGGGGDIPVWVSVSSVNVEESVDKVMGACVEPRCVVPLPLTLCICEVVVFGVESEGRGGGRMSECLE